MLRKALLLALALSPCLAEPSIAGNGLLDEPAQVAGAPFSAVFKRESVTTFTDGNRIVRAFTVQYFRDGQGRTRTERGEGPAKMIIIADPVGKQRYVVFPENKAVYANKTGDSTAMVVPMPQGARFTDDIAPFGLLGIGMGVGANPLTEASSDTTSLGEKSIDGEMATGTRLVRTIPSGVLGNDKPITSTLDRWVSADLGIPIQINQKSSIGGEFTQSVVKISRIEPDPSLFVPPADYTRQDLGAPGTVTFRSTGSTAVVTAVKKDGSAH